MILKSLVDYYESLLKRGEIAKPGWVDTKVSYALDIDKNGVLIDIISLMYPKPVEEMKNKKKSKPVMLPRIMTVPERQRRSSGKLPYYLCDNAKYMLGVIENDSENDSKKGREYFEASAEYHIKMLENIDSPAAEALKEFFKTWDPADTKDHDLVKKHPEIIVGNIVFITDGKFAHEDEAIQAAWDEMQKSETEENLITCSVTGKKDSLARLHPPIMGLKGAKPTGVALVSSNFDAANSYGKKQGENAQVGQYAASAYAAALNYLIRNNKVIYADDTAVFCYATDGNSGYQDVFNSLISGKDKYTYEDLQRMLTCLYQGKSVEYNESLLDPNMRIYILGLKASGGEARAPVSFFHDNTFGEIVENIADHQERLKIKSGNKESIIPIWQIVKETHKEKADPKPHLAGEIVEAVITNGKYPATLITTVMTRIRADQDINSTRAAIIKAYYSKNTNPQVPKEVLTVGLNTETKDVAYNLGRLFAVLEKIQRKAVSNIQRTIASKSYGGATGNPRTTFPQLIGLAQKHLAKIESDNPKYYNYYNGLIGKILANIEEFPNTLTPPQKSSFALGFYHQRQALWSKKENINKEEERKEG